MYAYTRTHMLRMSEGLHQTCAHTRRMSPSHANPHNQDCVQTTSASERQALCARRCPVISSAAWLQHRDGLMHNQPVLQTPRRVWMRASACTASAPDTVREQDIRNRLHLRVQRGAPTPGHTPASAHALICIRPSIMHTQAHTLAQISPNAHTAAHAHARQTPQGAATTRVHTRTSVSSSRSC